MASRHRSRERALQMIYQWDLNREPAGEVREAYWKTLAAETSRKTQDDDFAEQLFEQVTSQVSRIDDLIREHATNWRLERMAAVDRNILRMAVSELLDETATPAVIINEAMEVGRRFSTDESGPFLNGILDGIRKSLEAAAKTR